MERDEETKKMIDQAFLAGDEWLRRQGVVSEFTLNTIIVFIYSNFPNIKNVDLDVDKKGGKIYIRVHASVWRILFWILLGRRDAIVDAIFEWVREYLPTYKVFVEMRRSKGRRDDEISNIGSGDDGAELPELEGVANLSSEIRLNESFVYTKDDTKITTGSDA